MNKVWLVLDMNYLAHRSFHVFQGLNHGAAKTGVVYGVLRDVQTLMEQHATTDIAFCFDYGESLRKKLVPTYKAKRQDRYDKMSDADKAAYADMRKQVNLLRNDYLYRLGFKNVFYQDGYEADDIMASVVRNTSADDICVLVSADKDLYQLLSRRVMIWNPHREAKVHAVTRAYFRKHYGIEPSQWPLVKAIAGCGSDNVVGVKGVGDLTACKYLRTELKAGNKKYEAIKSEVFEWQKNLPLVRLPYPKCESFSPVKDKISPKAWRELTKELGMGSIRDRVPGSRGKGFGLSPNGRPNGKGENDE